jgi:hypothetical protein
MSRRQHRKHAVHPIPFDGPHVPQPAVSGPPDDGHTGSFTRPEDVLVVGPPVERAPDLSWSPAERQLELDVHDLPRSPGRDE